MTMRGNVFSLKNEKKASLIDIQPSGDPVLKQYDDSIADCQRRFIGTGDLEAAAELALNVKIRGLMLAQRGKVGEAIEHYQKAAAFLEPLASGSKPSVARRVLVGLWLSQANALSVDLNENERARDLYDKIICLLGSEEGARREGQCIFRNAPTLGNSAMEDADQLSELLVIQFAEAIAYRGDTRRCLGNQAGALEDIRRAAGILERERDRTVGEARRRADPLQAWIQKSYGML